MEFDTRETPLDNAHLTAQTKKIVMQPANPFFKPADIPDPITINETPANTDSEFENTANSSQLLRSSLAITEEPKKSIHHHVLFKITVISLSLVAGVVAGIISFIYIG